MKNVVFKTVGNVLVAVHGENNITDEEARACQAALKGMDLDRLRILVCTEGGGASATQRKGLIDAFDGRDVPTAIVTDVRMLRGVITALSWFNKNIRAFAGDEMVDALEYLGVSEHKLEKLVGEVNRLRVELKDNTPTPSRRTLS